MLPSSDELKRMGITTEPKPEDICYYKFFKSRRPDPEYDERCPLCNGYPVEGCFRYTTREHVEEFYKKYGLDNNDIGRLEDFGV